jgi:hypothetical protein
MQQLSYTEMTSVFDPKILQAMCVPHKGFWERRLIARYRNQYKETRVYLDVFVLPKRPVSLAKLLPQVDLRSIA